MSRPFRQSAAVPAGATVGRRNKTLDYVDWIHARDASAQARLAQTPPPAEKPRVERPLTANHLAYLEAIEKYQLTLVGGPAGSGKTVLACQKAAEFLRRGMIDRVVITRPLVECDEELGILPGTSDEKVESFLRPVLEGLVRYLGKPKVDAMRHAGQIELCPLARMRGRTLEWSFVIADEAQNMTWKQLHMLLTRFGDGSKFVVNGDFYQTDLKTPPALVDVMKALAKPRDPDIGFVLFTEADCLRPRLVQEVDRRLRNYAAKFRATPSAN